jgi:hypothetical protein
MKKPNQGVKQTANNDAVFDWQFPEQQQGDRQK